MAGPRQCEFLLVRYVPDAVKDEFINIGVVLLDPAGAFADVRFTRDWRRVRCLDPAADLEMLQAMEAEIRERLRAGGADRQRILHLLNDSFANSVQVSTPKGVLTDTPAQEMERLTELYVNPSRRGGKREGTAGRAAIVARMRGAFTQADVWRMMFRDIPVAEYTHPGDPLILDCAYQPNRPDEVIKFFHAVSLASDVNAAKVLGFSYPQFRKGMARIKNVRTELTAVTEDDLPRDDDRIAFALATLQGCSIQVATTSDLARLAAEARRDLGL